MTLKEWNSNVVSRKAFIPLSATIADSGKMYKVTQAAWFGLLKLYLATDTNLATLSCKQFKTTNTPPRYKSAHSCGCKFPQYCQMDLPYKSFDTVFHPGNNNVAFAYAFYHPQRRCAQPTLQGFDLAHKSENSGLPVLKVIFWVHLVLKLKYLHTNAVTGR